MPKAKMSSEKGSDINSTVNKVVEIIQFMGDNHLSELELETPELKMKLKKHSETTLVTHDVPSLPTMQFAAPQTIKQAPPAAKPAVSEAKEEANNFHKIISPMAGTFYRTPSPTSSPFVKEGDSVISGQTVCIVEAMKMMNEIKADKAGRIVKILSENGKPVDKGSELFYIGD